MKQKTFSFIFSAMLFNILLIACNENQKSSTTDAEKSGNEPSNNYQLTQERLRRFDSLDFQFYTSFPSSVNDCNTCKIRLIMLCNLQRK